MGVNRKTGERVAVKVIDKKKYWNTKNWEQLEREIHILKQIEHENIVRVIDLFSTDRYIYLVLELYAISLNILLNFHRASGGELFQHISEKGSFTEEEAREIFTQILKAVEYLHGRQIAHRDLKPENILFTKKGVNQIKITDFDILPI